MSFNFSIQTASFSKPPQNQPHTHKLPKNQSNHPQTSQTIQKPPKNQPIMSRKSAFYVTEKL